ncbi:hypothetical protein Poli38472_009941 [Pythium oligandrum]|uniref:Necrosis inducing protein n=1 Tax=Pythium oligandrum TaxID=41045 RepID=A0A8K1FG63_PYTOL|nr:hypothetical protein Poli38472_009941 [Pythium oligandrum]|eukprot:TMW58382.1 hypothetical protein Poli38472_009941 [Pythium oligandrum]
MKWAALLVFSAALLSTVRGDDFPKLDAAPPKNIDISSITPVLDMDTDSCLPSAAISRSGQQNGGLKPTGKITGGCRRGDFMDFSNTYHRYACVNGNGNQYCGHFFAYYFLKDQAVPTFGGGHRHDLEQIGIWTVNGRVTHGGFSAHGKMENRPVDQIPQEGGRLKFVYHKDGVVTHAIRFGKTNEGAENPTGAFVVPTLVSWFTMKGDTIDNAGLRNNLNSFDYGNANMPIKDNNFLSNLNKFRPSDFPEFTQESIDTSQ